MLKHTFWFVSFEVGDIMYEGRLRGFTTNTVTCLGGTEGPSVNN